MADSIETSVSAPVVVDLGKVRKKRIRQLKKGRGKLMDDVQEALAEVTEGLGQELKGKEIVPIVIVYRQKSKKRSRRSMWPGF